MPIANPWDNNYTTSPGSNLPGTPTTPTPASNSAALGSLPSASSYNQPALGSMNPATGTASTAGATPATPRTNTPAPAPANPSTPRTSPWTPNVTATNWDGSQMSLASPNNPNINYITGDAARNIGAAYGGNIVTGGATTGGAIDADLYGLDLGFGDPFSAGQVQFMRDRGDSEAQIRAHLTHPAMWWANGADPNGVRNSDVNWNFSQPFANNLGTGGVNQAALARTSANQTAFGPNGSVNTQMSVPVVNGNTSPTSPTAGNSTANAGNNAAMSFLMQLLGPQFLQMLLGQSGTTTQRPPALSGTARVGNRYRSYEPQYY